MCPVSFVNIIILYYCKLTGHSHMTIKLHIWSELSSKHI